MKLLLDLQGLQSKSRERGIGRQNKALAHAILDAAGRHEVHVLLSEDLARDAPDAHLDLADRLPRERVHGFGPYGAIAEHMPANRWRARAASLLREAAVARLRPDIVHLGSLFEGYVDDAVASVGQLAVAHATAVTLHDLIPLADPARYLGFPGYGAYYYRHCQDLKRADLLLAVSRHSRDEAVRLLRIPEDRTAIIRAGVSEAFRPVSLSSAAAADLRRRLDVPGPFILHVGAGDPRKNLGTLVEAHSRLPGTLQTGRKLLFAGHLDKGEIDLVQAAARRFGVPAATLVFPGFVDDPDLVALYGLCDALVFPSLNEGFGLPLLEAMACGAPVLAADATSLPEVVGRPDVLFDGRDARALAERLTPLLTDEGRRRELSRWGRERASTFTWRDTARRAIEAFEALHERRSRPAATVAGAAFRRRPRLAFVSPLPPDPSGVADYGMELLRELLVHYEIDCIHPTGATSDAWVASNCGLRTVEWFESHAEGYDRVVYAVGNSSYHAHMFALLVRIPGVVVLHDAFLSDLAVDRLRGSVYMPPPLVREIYRSHGLTGVTLARDEGLGEAVNTLPMSGSVLRNAQGVILHSRHAAELTSTLLGPDAGIELAVVPLLRAPAETGGRAAAREELGLGADDFVVCGFGIVHPRKLNRLVTEAFLLSGLADDPACRLLFVGKDFPTYSREIMDEVAAAQPRAEVRFVGRVDAEIYGLYLKAADVAVQLRTESRGETSGAMLDVMAHGITLVATDLGAASEIAGDAIVKVPAGVEAAELAAVLTRLRRDEPYRAAFGTRAREDIARLSGPAEVGATVHGLIERFAAASPHTDEQLLLSAIRDLPVERAASRRDLEGVAPALRALFPPPGLRQILCDVSTIAQGDARTGIQRVTRSILARLIAAPPPGCRIEPVVIDGAGMRYARDFVEARLALPVGGEPSGPAEFRPGDHLLVLDWTPDRFPDVEGWLHRFRRGGGIVTSLVHDVLPLERPEFFPDWMEALFARWMDVAIRCSDRIACVSASTATRLAEVGAASLAKRTEPLAIGHFHLGYDVEASEPSTGLPPDGDAILARLAGRPVFLAVGTVEPRKGHGQLVAAFEELWAEGLDAALVVVGKEGWMVDEVAGRMRDSRHAGQDLIWLAGVSDEFLTILYRRTSALVAASYGEGFGLPLIEAAGHGVPVIARDLPVFREIGGEHAFYFDGLAPGDLARAVRAWLALDGAGRAPSSAGLTRQTWARATERLLGIMFGTGPVEWLAPGDGAGGAAEEADPDDGDRFEAVL